MRRATALLDGLLLGALAPLLVAAQVGEVELLPGCAGNVPTLWPFFDAPGVGDSLLLALDGNPFAGLFTFAQVFAAASPILPGSPCGVVLPGAGEVLIAVAPPPLLVAAALATSGNPTGFVVTVPDDPALVGLELWLQGLYVQGAFTDPAPHRLSQGLRIRLGA
ncbi:MAG TPA: hypothetical protein VJP77_03440 [Planctomycetota bacterium]|nr:hypothetical protein [Planctomycetota bacterium]